MKDIKVTDSVKYIGVDDHDIDLFESQYVVPNGVSYNSYVILDEKVAVMDTVDANFADEWLANVAKALDGRKPDYLIVQHMEPDHSANIENFVKAYPEATVVANTKTFAMMKNFFPKMDLAGPKASAHSSALSHRKPSRHSTATGRCNRGALSGGEGSSGSSP